MSQSVGPSYFYEDEVYRVSKSGDVEFGMVTENWEMYSSSDDEDMQTDKVLPGHVCVSWFPKGKEEVLPEAKVYDNVTSYAGTHYDLYLWIKCLLQCIC